MSTRASSLLAEVPDLAGHEARRLLLLAADAGLTWLLGDPMVTRQTSDRFRALAERRRQGEPLQYIEGTVQFGPIELLSDPRALIPRPETERLWEIAVDLVAGHERPRIVDLCTGSGNLALAMKHIRPDAIVVGCDISADALELANANAHRLGLDVSFCEGDLFAPLPMDFVGAVDLIVSNPPYVATADPLPAEVRDYEPLGALLAADNGTAILRRIATEAIEWLRPGGVIVCEIGESQGEECQSLFATYSPEIELDLAGRDRFIVGRCPMDRDVH